MGDKNINDPNGVKNVQVEKAYVMHTDVDAKGNVVRRPKNLYDIGLIIPKNACENMLSRSLSHLTLPKR